MKKDHGRLQSFAPINIQTDVGCFRLPLIGISSIHAGCAVPGEYGANLIAIDDGWSMFDVVGDERANIPHAVSLQH